MEKRLHVFCCYARKDQQWLLELETHLAPLQREGLITLWDDMDIYPGDEWEKEIRRHLEAAQIILLLVSPNFIASDYGYSVEMQQAMEQHERGEARVIPIILHPVYWKKTPFAKLQALPTNAKAITSSYWPHPNEAFYTVVEGIRKIVEASATKNSLSNVLGTAGLMSRPNHPGGVQPQNRSYHILRLPARLSGVLLLLLGLFSGLILARLPFPSLAPSLNATVVPIPSYLSGSGTLALVDPLNRATRSLWHPFSNSEGGTCQFAAGAYHVSQQPTGYYNWCHPNDLFSNFAFEVQVTITQGDCGGMVFRENGDGLNLYYYAICADSEYGLLKYISHSNGKVLQSGQSSTIHAGLGQQNTIAVVADGNTMIFYANGQKIAQVQDSSYASGHIGLVADPRSSGSLTDLAFTNAKVWRL